MAKSMRSKKVKRLRALRREMIEPLYDKKDEAKYAAQEAALAAPKLPVRPPPGSSSMDVATITAPPTTTGNMEIEMICDDESKSALKPVGGVGKKSNKNFKVGRNKRGGKGKGQGRFKRKRHV